MSKISEAERTMYENVVLNNADPAGEVTTFNETASGLLGH